MKDDSALDAADEHILGFDRSDDSWLGLVRDVVSPSDLGRIGEYELLDEIGRGAQGVVYRARQPKTRREIALKRLAGGAFVSASQRIRFEREVETAAALRHPNIVTVFGMDVVDNQPLLAMEWIDGTPVDAWANHGPHGPRPIDQRLTMFLRICDAVQHAHQRGVIHRDLKPSNILVDRDNQPRLLDFGLAKIADRDDDSSKLTLTHDFVGTPAYASPEQLEHGAAHIDSRSDVYSLGVILYQLLTGELPHPAKGSLADLASRIQNIEAPPPSSRNAALGKDLDYVVQKALAKEPQRRYATVDAFSADVSRYLEGRSVLAHPPSTAYQLRKFVRRHRWPVMFSTAVLALIVAGAAVSTTLAIQLGRERDRAVTLAEQEASARSSAETVSAFLQSLFAAVDPAEAQGRDVTAHELLAEGGAQVRAEFEDDPELKATLLHTIGSSYLSLGRYDDAKPYLQDALTLRTSLFPEPHPAVNQSLRQLATWHRKTGDLSQAESLARRALEMAKSFATPPDLTLASSMDDLAIMLHELGRYDEAGDLNRRALEMRRQLPDEPGVDVAASLNNMAGVRFAHGDYAAAEALLEQAVALNEAAKGDTHPDTLANLNNLAGMRMMLGDLEEAETAFHEILARRTAVLGAEHPEVAQTMNNLGEVLRRQGRLEDAQSVLADALDIRREALPAGHLDIARTLNNLALTTGALGDYASAESMHREALDIRRLSVGEDHPLTATSLSNLAFTLHKLGRLDEAESLGRDALNRRRTALGPDHIEATITMTILADILVDAEKPEEAERLARNAVAILVANENAEHRLLAQSQCTLGKALAAQNFLEEAEATLLNAWTTGSETPAADNIANALASLYERQNMPDEAATWALKATNTKRVD